MYFTLKEWRDATNGEILAGDPDTYVGGEGPGGLAIDSRTIKPGQWIASLIGKSGVDGHKYLKNAVTAGACGVIVSDRNVYESTIRPDYPALPALLVSDTTIAIGDAARAILQKYKPFVIAITGTVGKTGVKENVAHIAGKRWPVLKTPENWNTEIGLPLTVFNLTPDHKIVVLECAARGLGQIHYLSMIANPDIAVVTHIGPGHLSEFGSIENIARAKWEIADGLKENGVVVANGESPYTFEYLDRFNLITFGLCNDCDVHPESIEIHDNSIDIRIATPAGLINTSIQGSSRADITNALAAVACAIKIKIKSGNFVESLSLYEITNALRDFPATSGRLQKIIRASGVEVIFDGYNSNPLSLANALDMFAARNSLSSGGNILRRIAILGDMLELGEDQDKYHSDAGKHISSLNFDLLITVGDLAKFINGAASGIETKHFDTTGDCANELSGILKPGDVVLIKASRALEFEKLLETDW
ncbi:MAG: UDP-N-acetylmuramoyl-tripeptide--D-alanyl-D-alanine ligase [bacterium]|nr:UDP-N-acetylmuramoyl-tripeptide--D-alanyl-D-alanine ligase [bacterium]